MAHSRKTDPRQRHPGLECPYCLARHESVGHSALKELRTASDMILSLREEKHALKEALHSSLTKSDDLYEKVLACEYTLKDEVKRRKAAEDELKKTRGESSMYQRKLDETKELLVSRELELQRLERSVDKSNRDGYISSLEASNRALKGRVGDLSLELEAKEHSDGLISRKVEKYCKFISAKLKDFPDYLALFRGRFKKADEFKAVEREGGLLKVLQFLADLLAYEAQQLSSPRRRQDTLSDEELAAHQNEMSSHLKSFNKSIQTRSEKSTNTRETAISGQQSSSSMFNSIFEKNRTPSLGKDTSFNTLHQATLEYPRTPQYKERSYTRDAFYNAGFNETNGLIEVLSFQNDKLNKLNQQIAETMASSKSLLSSKSFETRAKSAARGYLDNTEGLEELDESLQAQRLSKVRSEKALAIPRPPPIDLELDSPKRSRNALGSPPPSTRNSTKATAKPTPTSFNKRSEDPEVELPGKTEFLKSPKASNTVRLKSPKSIRDTSASRARQTTERKGDPKKETILKTMPLMRPGDGWKSVGDFFGGEEDEKKPEVTEGVKQ